ncbi:hypothetical protein, partial [Brevibacterium casei]|uniref:hypothetical protein n=1 Tax=Brevibacterium casei TaxID=33889 RepID=UPI002468705B
PAPSAHSTDQTPADRECCFDAMTPPATYSANALYIILALACGALSASSWGSSYAYLIALPVQILTLALVPVLVKRSKVGRQRLHLSNNNFLLERRADLKRAIDRVNDQITEIDPK